MTPPPTSSDSMRGREDSVTSAIVLERPVITVGAFGASIDAANSEPLLRLDDRTRAQLALSAIDRRARVVPAELARITLACCDFRAGLGTAPALRAGSATSLHKRYAACVSSEVAPLILNRVSALAGLDSRKLNRVENTDLRP